MYGKMTVSRTGNNLNQTFHGVPEEIFRQAELQMTATGAVNVSWIGSDHRQYHYLADKVNGVSFERDYS